MNKKLNNVKIQYLDHSAFLVKTQQHAFLFDYGAVPVRLPESLADLYKKISQLPLDLFFSHMHADHWNPELAEMMAYRPNTRIFLGVSSEKERREKEADKPHFVMLGPRFVYDLPDEQIITTGSTDQGVSFLVLSSEITLYHGGDLAVWDDDEIDRSVYLKEIHFLSKQLKKRGKKPDVAFLPVTTSDGYQEPSILEGIDWFLTFIQPRLVIPMHGHGYERLYLSFAEWMAQHHPCTDVLVLQKPGSECVVQIEC